MSELIALLGPFQEEDCKVVIVRQLFVDAQLPIFVKVRNGVVFGDTVCAKTGIKHAKGQGGSELQIK